MELALERLLGPYDLILAQALPQLFSHLGIGGDDLDIKPEEMAHLVERRFEDIQGINLGLSRERFHQFRVAGRLHGSAVELLLNRPQVFRDAQNAEMNFIHAGAVIVIAIHVVLSLHPTIAPGGSSAKIPRVHELR